MTPPLPEGYSVSRGTPCILTQVTEGRAVTAPYVVPLSSPGQPFTLNAGVITPMAKCLGFVDERPMLREINNLKRKIEDLEEDLARYRGGINAMKELEEVGV